MPTFNEKFEQLRRRAGVTIRDVATALQMGVGTVGGWAKSSRPRPEVARRLAEFFSVSVDDLLDDKRALVSDKWQELQVAEATAASKYPANPQARDENFDAQLFERQTREERLAHAASLRQVAKTLAQQATDYITKAERLESLPQKSVTQTPHPKPDKTARGQANEAALRRLARQGKKPHQKSA